MRIDNNTFKIESEKQDNGIWGTPINCVFIDRYIPLDEKTMLLESAIVVAVAEYFKRNFEIRNSNKDGFGIWFDNKNHKALLWPVAIRHEDWELQDDILIFKKYK